MNLKYFHISLFQVFIAVRSDQNQHVTNNEEISTAKPASPLYSYYPYWPSNYYSYWSQPRLSQYYYPYGPSSCSSCKPVYSQTAQPQTGLTYPYYALNQPPAASTYFAYMPAQVQNSAASPYKTSLYPFMYGLQYPQVHQYGKNSTAETQLPIPPIPFYNGAVFPLTSSIIVTTEAVHNVSINNTLDKTNNTVESDDTSSLQPSNSSELIFNTSQVQTHAKNLPSSITSPVYNSFIPSYNGLLNPLVINPGILSVPNTNLTSNSTMTLWPQTFSSLPFAGYNLHPNMPPATAPLENSTEQVNNSEMASIISSNGEVGANIEDLPPQVKDFINMIPDILSMPESSQLNPSSNGVIHNFGGLEMNNGGESTPATGSYKPKDAYMFKKKHFLPRRYHNTYAHK